VTVAEDPLAAFINKNNEMKRRNAEKEQKKQASDALLAKKQGALARPALSSNTSPLHST